MNEYYNPVGGFIFFLLIRELLAYQKHENKPSNPLALFAYLISFIFFFPVMVLYEISSVDENKLEEINDEISGVDQNKLEAFQNNADLFMVFAGFVTLIVLLSYPCKYIGNLFTYTIIAILIFSFFWLGIFVKAFAI